MILEKFLNDIQKSKSQEYQKSINILAKKYPEIRKFAMKVDELVLENTTITSSLEIPIKSFIECEYIIKNSENGIKTAGIISKVVIKSLKVAQTILMLLLVKSPFRVSIAYNALHNVIRILEQQVKKNLVKKV